MGFGPISIICYLVIAIAGALWLKCGLTPGDPRPKSSSVMHQQAWSSLSRHHICEHCQRIRIIIPTYFTREQLDLVVRLPLTVTEVAQATAATCPLLRDAHIAASYGVATRLAFHYQVFTSILVAKSPLHAFTGCVTINDRVRYFLHTLSSRPFYLRLHRLSTEAGGTTYARLHYSAWHSFEFDITASAEDHAAQYISERPLNYDVASEKTLGQARRWLAACTNRYHTHGGCSPEWQVGYRYSRFVPTRLVEIQRCPEGYLCPRIIHSDTEKQLWEPIEWTCLSYCWGGDQVIKTTSANLAERATGLPFAKLPQTLKDALFVTDKLGHRFIWIDALCIVQDDAEDVAREIASMPDIYKNGVCTIAASRASNSYEGFLQAHEPEAIHHKPVQLSITCPDGQPGHILVSSRGGEYRYEAEPIHTRAWCFQERILSMRVLDFGHTQLRWTCLSRTEVDGGNAKLAASTDLLIGRSLQTLGRQKRLQAWQDLVAAYTRRNLSFVGDKLLAISAIAAEFAPSMEDDYLAGLWRGSLATQLGWRAGRPRNARPTAYIAPTWSWAAASDKVYFTAESDSVPSIEVLHCEVQLAHSYAPFGAVIDGFIVLRGRIREINWYVNRNEIHMERKGITTVFISDREGLEAMPGHGKTHFLGWVSIDALADEWPNDQDFKVSCWCFKIRERTQKQGTGCLLLRSTGPDTMNFHRMAYFELGDAMYRYDPPIDEDFFDDVEPEEVTIT